MTDLENLSSDPSALRQLVRGQSEFGDTKIQSALASLSRDARVWCFRQYLSTAALAPVAKSSSSSQKSQQHWRSKDELINILKQVECAGMDGQLGDGRKRLRGGGVDDRRHIELRQVEF